MSELCINYSLKDSNGTFTAFFTRLWNEILISPTVTCFIDEFITLRMILKRLFN